MRIINIEVFPFTELGAEEQAVALANFLKADDENRRDLDRYEGIITAASILRKELGFDTNPMAAGIGREITTYMNGNWSGLNCKAHQVLIEEYVKFMPFSNEVRRLVILFTALQAAYPWFSSSIKMLGTKEPECTWFASNPGGPVTGVYTFTGLVKQFLAWYRISLLNHYNYMGTEAYAREVFESQNYVFLKNGTRYLGEGA